MKFIPIVTSILTLYFSLNPGYAQDAKGRFSVVCSFKCSNTTSQVISSCYATGNGLVRNKPIESFHVNPYAEFGLIIATLRKDRTNPYPLLFSFKECYEVCNAASVMIDSLSYIYYNPNFLNSINSNSEQLKWIVRSIIAHEIGHHLYGHTIPGAGVQYQTIRRKQELLADHFSGFVIKQFPGATVEDALAGIRSLDAATYRPRNTAEENINDYPTLANRETAIREAFSEDPNHPLRLGMFRNIDSVALATLRRSGRSIILHEIDRAISFNNMKEAMEKLNELKKSPLSPEERSVLDKVEKIASDQHKIDLNKQITPSTIEEKDIEILKDLYEQYKKKNTPTDQLKAETLLKSIKELEVKQVKIKSQDIP